MYNIDALIDVIELKGKDFGLLTEEDKKIASEILDILTEENIQVFKAKLILMFCHDATEYAGRLSI